MCAILGKDGLQYSVWWYALTSVRKGLWHKTQYEKIKKSREREIVNFLNCKLCFLNFLARVRFDCYYFSKCLLQLSENGKNSQFCEPKSFALLKKVVYKWSRKCRIKILGQNTRKKLPLVAFRVNGADKLSWIPVRFSLDLFSTVSILYDILWRRLL